MKSFLHQEWSGRAIVGAVFIVFVWVVYAVRILFGVGPMHDFKGNQAPAFDYLAGAGTVTMLVIIWIVGRGIMARKRSGS